MYNKRQNKGRHCEEARSADVAIRCRSPFFCHPEQSEESRRCCSTIQSLVSECGQVLPYTLILALILIMSWAMMVNIAKIIRDRTILQNKVDNAVLSIATLQARTLNFLGTTNNLTATILSTAGYPESLTYDVLISNVPSAIRGKVKDIFGVIPTLYVPSFSTDKVCGSLIPGPFCDYKCNGIRTEYGGVKNLRTVVNSIQKMQDAAVSAYLVNYAAILKEFSADNTKIVVVPSRFVKDIKSLNFGNINLKSVSPQSLLGIKKNSKGIKYFKTKNYCLNIVGVHAHFVKPEEYRKDKYSWYVQDENFYDKKLVALGIQNLDNDKNYPLFQRVFNIKMPQLVAVSSAGLYNTKGAMFPDTETDKTGVNFASVSSLYILGIQSQMLITLASELSGIPVIGWAAAALTAGLEVDMTATSAMNFYNAKKDKNTPIYTYKNAKLGGWDSHLIPL